MGCAGVGRGNGRPGLTRTRSSRSGPGRGSIGLRKPSLKKSIKARTTGRAKRAIKRKVIPGYGRKGMGWLRDPKRAAYNAVYRRTTVGLGDVLKMFK